MSEAVNNYIEKLKIWKEETAALRSIILELGLEETIKWGKPCYMLDSRNILLIQGFKPYCALLFFKGVLMEDPHQMLMKTGENTEVASQLRFTSREQIVANEDKIKFYIQEAIRVEHSGAKIVKKPSSSIKLPVELEEAFDQDNAFKEAFFRLTPGRQKAYAIFFAQPKQTKTRRSRIENAMPKIFDGIGLNDR